MITDPSQWKYVDTTENPTHIETRGKPAKHLMESSWFIGPRFLNADSFESFHTALDYGEFRIADDDPEI